MFSKGRQSLRSAVVVALIFTLVVPEFAHAYLDPGTGSYILQIIAAGALSSLFLVKSYWARIKGVFVRSDREQQERDEQE